MRILPLALLLVSCGRHGPPSAARLEALGSVPPRLPAPQAEVYAVHLGVSSDPLVARVTGDLPWEESLSGAAGALGIEAVAGRSPDPWHVRWAALRAGYPYPVEEFTYERVAEGAVGQRIIDGLQGMARPGDHVGLVRVRGGDGDFWVGLLGRPRLIIEPVPRVLPPGGRLDLEAVGGTAKDVELTLVSPSGRLDGGDLWQKRSFTLTERGEYWVQVADSQGVLAGFPVFVGVSPEPAPPMGDLRLAAGDPVSLLDSAWDMLDRVREQYGWEPLQDDPILGPVARAHLGDRLGDSGPASGAFPGEPGSCRASLSCGLLPGTGVESCFQSWLVQPEPRSAMLDPRCTVAGLATDRSGGRLWLQLELGQE